MKIKTSDLTGAALDWAVTKAMAGALWGENYDVPHPDDSKFYPSTNWAQGGRLIVRENIDIRRNWPELGRSGDVHGGDWFAEIINPDYYVSHGETPLIAATRCYVMSKLGSEVVIPWELV